MRIYAYMYKSLCTSSRASMFQRRYIEREREIQIHLTTSAIGLHAGTDPSSGLVSDLV